jgi:hypothetical protein
MYVHITYFAKHLRQPMPLVLTCHDDDDLLVNYRTLPYYYSTVLYRILYILASSSREVKIIR